MIPEQWIVQGETGISSRTIWAALMGIEPVGTRCSMNYYDVPMDAADFRLCYLLLELVGWRERIAEVGNVFPKWNPLTDRWDELEALYLNAQMSDLSKLLRSIYPECMLADGWIQTSPCSWSRSK